MFWNKSPQQQYYERLARLAQAEERLQQDREGFDKHLKDSEERLFNTVVAMTKPETEYLEKLKKDAKELRRVCDLCVLALHDFGMAQLSMELQREVDKVFGEKK